LHAANERGEHALRKQGNQNGLFATPPKKTWRHSHPQEKRARPLHSMT